MALLANSLKLITTQTVEILFKIRMFLIALAVMGAGILIGYLANQSHETAQLTLSIVIIIILLPFIIHKPLNGVLLCLFFMPFLESWIEIPLGAGIPDLSFSRFIIAFLGIALLAKAAIGEFRFAPLSLADICIIATTIGLMASAPLSIKPSSVIQEVISRHFTPLVMYFFAKNLVQNRQDLNRLLLVVALFGFIAAAYAIYEYYTGHILFVGAEKVVENLRTEYTSSLRLIRGLLGRSGNFGRVLISTIPITFYLFFESKGAQRKLLLVGMLAVQFYSLFLTYNRSSWYALLISLSLIQFFYPQFRRAFFLIVFVAVVALWATWDQVNSSAVVEERLNHKTDDYNGRSQLWDAAINMWKAKPVLGWGFGRYEQESGKFRTDGESENLLTTENDYLYIMVGSGLVGILPYILFILFPLINSLFLFFRARAPDWSGFIKPEIITIYWCLILSFVITSYTQVQTQPIVKMIPFVVAGAIVGTHEHRLRCSKETQPFANNLPAKTASRVN